MLELSIKNSGWCENDILNELKFIICKLKNISNVPIYFQKYCSPFEKDIFEKSSNRYFKISDAIYKGIMAKRMSWETLIEQNPEVKDKYIICLQPGDSITSLHKITDNYEFIGNGIHIASIEVYVTYWLKEEDIEIPEGIELIKLKSNKIEL